MLKIDLSTYGDKQHSIGQDSSIELVNSTDSNTISLTGAVSFI